MMALSVRAALSRNRYSIEKMVRVKCKALLVASFSRFMRFHRLMHIAHHEISRAIADSRTSLAFVSAAHRRTQMVNY